MSNVTRVLLSEPVSELVLQADQSAAYAILNRAVDVQEREGREMTLPEALQTIHTIAAGIEQLYEEAERVGRVVA